jgi:hypothetical protein
MLVEDSFIIRISRFEFRLRSNFFGGLCGCTQSQRNKMSDQILKNLKADIIWRLTWVSLFAIAFAWVESSVVVYLREIFYGGSFYFPIVVDWDNGQYAANHLTSIELFRETATIIMLAAIGCLSGKNRLQKISFFMIAFGIWDIFYYVWLYMMIGWPEHLMTWDLLFLIPLPWVAPVVTPVLISIAMIAAGSLFIYFDEMGIRQKFFWYDWVILMGCVLIIITAFCWDWKNIIRFPDGIERTGIPNPFLWKLYLPAFCLSVCWFSYRFIQNIRKISHKTDIFS